MKGFISGAAAGLLAVNMLPEHPLLAFAVVTLLPIVILAFWTGAIGIRIERD
jgi:hypothetical protein